MEKFSITLLLITRIHTYYILNISIITYESYIVIKNTLYMIIICSVGVYRLSWPYLIIYRNRHFYTRSYWLDRKLVFSFLVTNFLKQHFEYFSFRTGFVHVNCGLTVIKTVGTLVCLYRSTKNMQYPAGRHYYRLYVHVGTQWAAIYINTIIGGLFETIQVKTIPLFITTRNGRDNKRLLHNVIMLIIFNPRIPSFHRSVCFFESPWLTTGVMQSLPPPIYAYIENCESYEEY